MAAAPTARVTARRLACLLATVARQGWPCIGRVSAFRGMCIRGRRERREYEPFCLRARFARWSCPALARSDEFHGMREIRSNIRKTRRLYKGLSHDEIAGLFWRDTSGLQFR